MPVMVGKPSVAFLMNILNCLMITSNASGRRCDQEEQKDLVTKRRII